MYTVYCSHMKHYVKFQTHCQHLVHIPGNLPDIFPLNKCYYEIVSENDGDFDKWECQYSSTRIVLYLRQIFPPLYMGIKISIEKK